jgi:hypothetical protein
LFQYFILAGLRKKVTGERKLSIQRYEKMRMLIKYSLRAPLENFFRWSQARIPIGQSCEFSAQNSHFLTGREQAVSSILDKILYVEKWGRLTNDHTGDGRQR